MLLRSTDFDRNYPILTKRVQFGQSPSNPFVQQGNFMYYRATGQKGEDIIKSVLLFDQLIQDRRLNNVR